MSDKLQIAREEILQRIESGELPGGVKLPAAREFAATLGSSFAVTQLAFHSLTRDGILRAVPRQGTYVREDWRERILPGSFRVFRPMWNEIIRTHLIPGCPEIRVSERFHRGTYEIRSSWDAHRRQDDYLDLTGFFEEAWPDRRDFFMERFQPYQVQNGRCFGIPLIFSPWVIACNVRVFEAAKVELPQPGWSWEEFLETLRRLRRHSAPNGFFHPASPNFYLGVLARSGGAIVSREGREFRLRLDDPRTLDGFRRLKELREVTGDSPGGHAYDCFRAGNLAMLAASREDICFDETFPWSCVPLPVIPGGADLTWQAGELLCIRRQVNDFDEVARVIRTLLGTEVQNHLADACYGIPIRRSSAIRSFREDDPRDRIFFSEMTKIAPDCQFAWPEIYRLVLVGLGKIWWENADPETVIRELAPALRTIIRYTPVNPRFIL